MKQGFHPMADNTKKPIELSSIENFEIEPAWVKTQSDTGANDHTGEKQKRTTRDEKRDGRSKGSQRKKASYSKDRNQRRIETNFEFQLLPQRNILEKIKSEMRKTGVSYALSDICETITAKGERYLIKIKFKEEKEKSYIKTIVDQKVFSSDEKAIDHLFRNNFDQCFVKELDQEEKPIKTFSYVYQCPKTEILLPPNNYHRYEEIIKQHILLNGIREGYENFCKRLIKVNDPETIKLWTEKPLMIYKFAIKNAVGNWFRGIEQLRAGLIREMPNSLFEKEAIIKISGDKITLLETNIKEQFERYFNFKANWISNLFAACLINLKKSHFTLFKYSEKKHTYACAYKRNNLQDNQLSKNAQKILSALKKSKKNKKGLLLKEDSLKALEPKEILLELKWMVKEGYVTEFADGILEIN